VTDPSANRTGGLDCAAVDGEQPASPPRVWFVAVDIPGDGRSVLARFAERARDALLADGWALGPDGPSAADSIFLGSFQQPVAPDFVATVQLILESGPFIVELDVRPTRGVVRTHRVSASVGGELGVRHLPTGRLLGALGISCEADISLDLAEILQDRGEELPSFTDEAGADAASALVVDLVAAQALPFAREHADVDRMLQFVRDGRQITRVDMFEYLFVPTLLAVSGRTGEARAALSDYGARIRPDDDEEYSKFRDRLNGWLH
jgi:hypothetical protein